MTHFTSIDRQSLQLYLGEGYSYEAIGRKIGKDKSSISREITRNGFNRHSYTALQAEARSRQRRFDAAPRPKRSDEQLMTYVESKLLENHSPQQIAGSIKHHCKNASISHQTIYNHLDSLPKNDPHRLAMRRKGRRNRKAAPGFVANKHKHGLSIHDRLAITQRRGRIGDWEMDLVQCAGASGYLITAVDRRTRYTLVHRVRDKTAGRVAETIIKMFSKIDPGKVKSMTFDCGSEFSYTRRIAEALKVKIYFCDPYCSQQRGTNENTNGLLRQYFPKSLQYGYISHQDVQRAQQQLNDRPRKTLKFGTPQLAFERQPIVAFRI